MGIKTSHNSTCEDNITALIMSIRRVKTGRKVDYGD